MRKFLIALGLVCAFVACKTDFDINAPYESKTVVYGFIDPSETVNYIKINKTFLGDGDARDYAAIRDSSEYPLEDVYAFIENKTNGNKVELQPFEVTNKQDDGAFYHEGQTVYTFTHAGNLDQDATYRLEIRIQDGSEEKVVEAEAGLVNSFNVTKPLQNRPDLGQAFPVKFYEVAGGGRYVEDIEVEWTSGINGKKYDVAVRFKYREVYLDNTTADKYFDWYIGSRDAQDLRGGHELLIKYQGEDFFKQVAENVKEDANVQKRIFKGLDYVFTVAGDELATYLEVNAPSTGLVQERPEYTNIENGIGLFSSRYTQKVADKWPDQNSFIHLCRGELTQNLQFCADTLFILTDSGSPYYCPN